MENIQPQTKLTPSEVFRLWADKVEKNSKEDFGGVFVIIPPMGEPITSLLIDKEKDINMFFALVKSKLEAAVDVLNEAQKRKMQGYG